MVSKPAPRRARGAIDKQQRRTLILRVALDLLTRQDYQSLRMQSLADACGLAKGTLYLYFRSKEGLFMALCTEVLDDWLTGLRPTLHAHSHDAEALSRAMASDLVRRPVLRRLMALLHNVLEHNVTHAEAEVFKRELKGLCDRAATELERALLLPAGSGLELLLDLHALVIGAQSLAQPAPLMVRLHLRDEYAGFRVDLESMLGRLLHARLAQATTGTTLQEVSP